MSPRDLSPRPPLYARIEQRLRDAIAEGRYAVGTVLPTEAELCATLKVSRHTVREALRRLVEAGLVERRQGAGSIVIAREPERGEVFGIPSINGLLRYGDDTRLLIHRHGMAPLGREEAALAQGEVGAMWLSVQGLRIGQDGRPLATTDILIHPRFAAIAADLPERGAIHHAIERRFGVEVVEVVQEIQAGPLPAAAANALRRRRRATGMLLMRRHVLTDGETLLVSRNWHPAEGFTYVMRLRRQEG
jgi:DNA-binding GntR family transcriptional regulator